MTHQYDSYRSDMTHFESKTTNDFLRILIYIIKIEIKKSLQKFGKDLVFLEINRVFLVQTYTCSNVTVNKAEKLFNNGTLRSTLINKRSFWYFLFSKEILFAIEYKVNKKKKKIIKYRCAVKSRGFSIHF